MRIDLFLNKVCLTKTRSIAKNACDKNLVQINGKIAKPSQEVKVGDTVRLDLYGFSQELTVLELPAGNVTKKDVTRYYKLLSKIPL
ncbi:MAG TPA: S4 domain-containing protein [Candidatus Cloacimonadota bacterium]|nr:S4 domain-containing protein [Candidatus Cloacimonadota bacterium]HQL14774.1 S4 domain-containing protein [Candidatus Cloacimonadota bacterium]